MELLINEVELQSVRSVYDDRPARFPDSIPLGTTWPLQVGVVDRIKMPWSSRKFTPQDLTSTTFRAALGLGFIPPVAGKTAATFTAADSSTQTTAELDFDFGDADLELALDALSKMLAIGGVTVDQPDPGEMFFTVAFNNVGVRNLLSFDASNLVPLSVVDVQRAVTGDADTREVQTVRIVQNAGAINSLSASVASAGITLTQVTVGSGAANAQWRVALTGGIYRGSFTVSKTTGTQGTSGAILFDDTEAQIRAKLEAMTGVGVGNVSVLQEDEHTYLIEFIGGLALTAVTITVNGANLVAIPEKTGTLDLRTPGIAMLLNGSSEKVVTLEIEKTVGAAAPIKIFSRDVLLTRPVIDANAGTPQTPMPTFVYSIVLDSLTGSATSLEAVATVGMTLGTAYDFVLSAGGLRTSWKLVAGTADPTDPTGQVQPLDYNVATNAVYWIKTL